MLGRSIIWMGALIAVLTWMTAWAQGGGPAVIRHSSVGVVDMTTLWEKLQIVQDLERIFSQEQAKLQEEFEAKGEKIQLLQKELDSGAFAKDSADYLQREEQLIRSNVERESWSAVAKARLRRQHKYWFEEIYKRVVRACEDLASSQGLDVILVDNPIDFEVPDSSTLVGQILQKKVIYASPRVDQTPQVRERVDARYLRDGGAGMIKLAKP